ncbi:hypothetical protein LIP_3556 [Limnochorda pilosa]|uniref:Uncharacterized protein n=1 Tax=Limnochorda pilosa TaxID=1555112 RepID=A0A0K2SQT2_LIMPI|nr:hypothetical protein LIP_3556 [Limnochorda pilosa]
MSIRVRVLTAFLVLLFPILALTATGASAVKTVAVVAIENRSGLALPDIERAAEDLLSSFLAQYPAFSVVERARPASRSSKRR